MDSKHGERELRHIPASQTIVPVYVVYTLLCMKNQQKELGACYNFEG